MPVFYFYMTQRLSSQPCARIVEELERKQPSFSSWQKPAHPTRAFSHATCMCVVRGSKVDLQEFTGSCSSMKSSSKLNFWVPFQICLFLKKTKKKSLDDACSWLDCRKYPLSKSDGGQWMEPLKGSEWWKETSTLLSFIFVFLFFLLPCYFAHSVDWFPAFRRNNLSQTEVDEPFRCMDSRLKMLLSKHPGWILVKTSVL